MNGQRLTKIDHKSVKLPILSERLLYATVAILVFEGLIRKVIPAALGTFVFFTKDLLCLFVLYIISTNKLQALSARLSYWWKILSILFTPLLLYTAFLDLPLSIFAAKQYLLYTGISLLVPLAFPKNRIEQFKRFVAFFAFLLIPTTIVAILQNSLPASHWLNLSVGGESLAGFSAAGFLRVSSTFSFTGQYSWFLNAVCAFLTLTFILPPYNSRNSFFFKIVMPIGLGILLIIGVFITGGRTAVLGNAGCILLGFVLSSCKFPSMSIRKGLLVSLFLVPCFWLIREVKPEFFAAYEARSSGTEELSHEEEMQQRVLSGYTSWTDWFSEQDIASMLIGNGLGIMSNGSDRISTYAQNIRATGFWTEGDIPTTAWEGGLYLMFVWYGFRIAVILFCFRLWWAMKDYKYSAVSSFLLANVIINGLAGNIGMQPPVAIWWWLSIGAIITINRFDEGSLEKDSVSSINRFRRNSSSQTAVA